LALSRDSLQERIAKIILRGEFGIKQRIERAQWEERELYPLIEDLKAGRTVFGMPAGSLLEFKVIPDASAYIRPATRLGEDVSAKPDSGGDPPPPTEGT
jgi:hypothetical protein